LHFVSSRRVLYIVWQVLRLRGGAAKVKKIKMQITNFESVADDLPMVRKMLSYQAPSYTVFVNTLNADELMGWSTFAMKQKNMDRLIEYTLSQLAVKKEFEVFLPTINQHCVQT